MLFNFKEFVLVEFSSGVLIRYRRCFWTTPGTRALVEDFLGRRSQSNLAAAMADACARLHVTVPLLSSAGTRGTAYLGSGAFGIVVKVNNSVGNRTYALKLKLNDSRDQDFAAVVALMCVKPAESRCYVPVERDSLVRSDSPKYSAFLMTLVGVPFSPYQVPEKPHLIRMLRSLVRIHQMGTVHGDARFVNCVVTEDGHDYLWTDFMEGGFLSEYKAEEDVMTFLRSVDKNPKEPNRLTLISEYVKIVVSKQLGEATTAAAPAAKKNVVDELNLNQLLDQLLD
eukprot:gene1629-1774_t